MIRENLIKKILPVLLVISVLALSFVSVEASFDKYGYKKKDKKEEQRKFLSKLREDKKKVETAIDSTKTLIERSRNKPYLPELYLRLSELYIEKSRLVYFIRKTQVKDTVKSLDHLESNVLKNQAIEIYQRILGNFPDFGDRDKVHFFMAHEYRELGQIDEMVEQYRAIIIDYKDSRYVPEAYLLLGDYFFNSQDLEMATRHYESVLKYPHSSAVAVARYKLAWCHINKVEYKEAIKLLEESVTNISNKEIDIDTYKKKADIRLEALVDMAYCYGEAYKDKKPQDAITYFRKYAWSRPVYTIALEKMAYRYLIKKKWSYSAAIYRQLSILQHDPEKLLEYARKIFECVRAMDTFEDADQDMAYIIKALRSQRYSIHIPEEDKEKNLNDYELFARDIVTHLHHKAREEKSVSGFQRAADSYKSYLDFFKNSPAYEEMESNCAEALFSAKQYLEAGRQYEKLASSVPQKNKEREERLYGAIISYYTALKHNKEDLNYYQVVFARGGLKATGESYVSDFPDSKRVPNVLFNIAWITYDEGKHDEAIEKFSKFVEHYPKGKEAKVAIHLILDAFNLNEDYEGLINYGQKIINSNIIEDKELKSEVESIVHASESKVISSLTVTAVNDWEKGKANLIDFAEEKKSSGLGEQALNALVISGKERGDLETIFLAGSKFIVQYPNSPKVEDTLSILIDSSLKTAQFRIVAEYLENFANKLPKHTNTMDFIRQAGHIREDLGQYDLANRNYQRILDRSKNDDPKNEKIIFRLVDNAKRMGDIDFAIRILTGKGGYLSQVGKVKADIMLAGFYLQKGKLKRASKYRKKAYKAYRTKYAKQDEEISDMMAEMVYNTVHMSNKRYKEIRLKDRIDNKIVTAKAKLLKQLEKGYNEVIQYRSPKWALAACYSSYEINKEFARFLKESPLPDLAPEQKEQYMRIIQQKAQAYMNKADQYLQTGVRQAHKWEVCDPELAKYFINPSDPSGQSRRFDFFSGSSSSSEIAGQYLRDDTLKSLHYKLMKDPDDINTLIALAEAYIEREDFKHSILIAQKALDKMGDKAEPLKSVIYNTMGVSYLYTLDDTTAKDVFKKALENDSENIGAKVNLASLYQYYSHIDKANGIYGLLPIAGVVDDAEDLIHPRAKEFYHVHVKGSEK